LSESTVKNADFGLIKGLGNGAARICHNKRLSHKAGGEDGIGGIALAVPG